MDSQLVSCYTHIIKRNPAWKIRRLEIGASVSQSCPSFCNNASVQTRNPFIEGEARGLGGRTLPHHMVVIPPVILPRDLGKRQWEGQRQTPNVQGPLEVVSTEMICYSPCHAPFLRQPTCIDWSTGNYKSQPTSPQKGYPALEVHVGS